MRALFADIIGSDSKEWSQIVCFAFYFHSEFACAASAGFNLLKMCAVSSAHYRRPFVPLSPVPAARLALFDLFQV